jgi:hypothetical protein
MNPYQLTSHEEQRDLELLSSVARVIKDQRLAMIHDRRYGGGSKIFQNSIEVHQSGAEGVIRVDITRKLPGWQEWSEQLLRDIERPEDV